VQRGIEQVLSLGTTALLHARQALALKLKRDCTRFNTLSIYTDDSLGMAVGFDRLLRLLTWWCATVTELRIVTAAPHKRSIGQTVTQTLTFIGVSLALSLGGAYIPAPKVASGLGKLDAILSGEPMPMSAFRSLVGLLEHFRQIIAAGSPASGSCGLARGTGSSKCGAATGAGPRGGLGGGVPNGGTPSGASSGSASA
jgi:hypothetical protein